LFILFIACYIHQQKQSEETIPHFCFAFAFYFRSVFETYLGFNKSQIRNPKSQIAFSLLIWANKRGNVISSSAPSKGLNADWLLKLATACGGFRAVVCGTSICLLSAGGAITVISRLFHFFVNRRKMMLAFPCVKEIASSISSSGIFCETGNIISAFRS